MSFAIAGECYALPIHAVDEVVQYPSVITRVPLAPAFVLGVATVRGQVVPIIHQASRFAASRQAGAGGAPGRRLIIVAIGGLRAGFAVDDVTGIMSVDPSVLSVAPALGAGDAGQAPVVDRVAFGETGEVTLLIDPATLMSDTEREILACIAAASGSRDTSARSDEAA